MTPALALVLLLAGPHVRLELQGLPAPLAAGWERTPSDTASQAEGISYGLTFTLPEGLDQALGIQLYGLASGDLVVLDGRQLAPLLAGEGRERPSDPLYEVPPALASAGRHRLLVRTATAEEPFPGRRPPVLDALSTLLVRRLGHQLPQAVSAAAIAALGLVALVFFLRDRSRRDLGLYALLAVGVAAFLVARMPLWGLADVDPRIPERTAQALSFVLPPVGLLLLLGFLELPVGRGALALLAVPAAGLAVAAAAPGAAPRLVAALAGLSLLLPGAAVLVALARRRGGDAPLLFTGTAALLLSALWDAGTARGILVTRSAPVPLLGPSFLLFTGILLVAVADRGRILLVRATTDALTGLPNRAAFLERARRELARAERSGGTLALAMLDVDHFKRFNDRHGHQTGDRVLALAGRAVSSAIRGIDLAGRYGGEEFVFLLVDVDEAEAVAAVERVRAAVASVKLPKVPEPVTASAGVAIHHGLFERTTVGQLVRRADEALYASKRAGRDRTTLEARDAGPPTSPAEVRYR